MGFEQEGWVVNTLVEIGVPLVDILDLYDQTNFETVASEYSSKNKLKQKNEAMTQTSTTLTPQSEENDSVHIKSEPEIVKPIYQPIRNHQRVRERIKKLRKKHHQKFLEKVQK